jgi:hypothetical protein
MVKNMTLLYFYGKKGHDILISSWLQREDNALLPLLMFCVQSRQMAGMDDSTEFRVLL